MNVEGFAALTAEEMVMMPTIRRFVTHIAATKFHGSHLASLLKALEVSVYGRDSQCRNDEGRQLKDVLSPQAPRSVAHNCEDSAVLTGKSGSHEVGPAVVGRGFSRLGIQV